jgi:hypothetical protein
LKTAFTEETKTSTKTEKVATAGELLPDGGVLELIRTTAGSRPLLLHWGKGRDPIVAPEIKCDGKIFVPPKVHETLLAATTLPCGVADRGPATQLLAETKDLIDRYVGLSISGLAVVTAWIATTHFADVLQHPPALYIQDGTMDLAMTLLRILHCVARHAQIVAELDRAALRSLTVLQPTLLVNQSKMPAVLRGLCSASNYRDVVLPGPGGTVSRVASSKAIYLAKENLAPDETGLRLNLGCASGNHRTLDDTTILKVTDHFQPWWLAHRLRNLQNVRQSHHATSDPVSAASRLAQVLQTCTDNDADLGAQCTSELQIQEQNALAQQAWDPGCAIIEVVLARLHQREREIRVTDLARWVNVLLASRGEIRQYTPEEIGRRLQNLGFVTDRKTFGMILTLDRFTSIRIHQLAGNYKVGEKVASCPDCENFANTGQV